MHSLGGFASGCFSFSVGFVGFVGFVGDCVVLEM